MSISVVRYCRKKTIDSISFFCYHNYCKIYKDKNTKWAWDENGKLHKWIFELTLVKWLYVFRNCLNFSFKGCYNEYVHIALHTL